MPGRGDPGRSLDRGDRRSYISPERDGDTGKVSQRAIEEAVAEARGDEVRKAAAERERAVKEAVTAAVAAALAKERAEAIERDRAAAVEREAAQKVAQEEATRVEAQIARARIARRGIRRGERWGCGMVQRTLPVRSVPDSESVRR